MRTPTPALLAAVAALIASPAAAAEQPIKVGALLAVTGPASFLGAPEARTLEMLVEELNAKGGIGGRKIQLVVKDTGGEPGEGGLLRQAAHRGGEGLRHHRPVDQRRDDGGEGASPRRARPCSSPAPRPR